MLPNLSDEAVVGIIIGVPFIGLYFWGLITSVKAKAFNEGYKRGRSSVRYTEIVK
jgi:uncharacterized membrane protein YwzB